MKTMRLGDACEKIGSGATPRGGSEVYQTSGVALIRSQNVYNDGFKLDGLAYISAKHAKELESVSVQAGDVLLNITGDSVARVCQAPRHLLPARVNQHVAIIRPRKNILDPRYLKYFLSSPSMQGQMLALASAGATRNALTKGMIENFNIPAPDITEQRVIAHVLGTLDDKVELNRQTNETLEAMARAVFKSWFVDFDPVRARAEGRAPEGIDAETTALFPDSFEGSEVGKIPKGWGVGKLVDLTFFSREGLNPSEYLAETFDHYSIPAFDEGRIPKREAGSQIKSNKFLVQPGSVLLSKLNPQFPRVWLPYLNSDLRSICSTEFLVALPSAEVTREYLYSLFNSRPFTERLATLVTGTSNSHQRAKAEHVLNIDVVIPDEKCIRKYTEIVKPIFDFAFANVEQSQTLAAARDALLPKLMSGEIRVKP